MERTIKNTLVDLIRDKYILLSGPRQVGKTFFSKHLFQKYTYLNFDESTQRKLIMKKQWSRDKNLLILDEIHKMKHWKRYLKGLFDTEGVEQPVLVTGSARLDTYKKGGDSLAGRHYSFHLLPLSVKEVDPTRAQEVFDLLLRFGGFPDPFLKASDRSAKLWRKGHLNVVLREDLLDLEKVRDIKSIEILVDILADRVGSTLSLSSIAQTLEVSPNTIKHWIQILESLYVIFVIRPFAAHPTKSILKEPKIYFYDTGRVTAGDAARLENLAANHLLKRMHFIQDTQGEKCELLYIKDKEKREIDFITLVNRKPEWLIEIKTSETVFSSQLYYYHKRLNPLRSLQLIYNLKQTRSTPEGLEAKNIAQFMAELET